MPSILIDQLHLRDLVKLMRLGIFGGSFNPVHLGHLILAETCREQIPLDEVWFIPVCTSPHKRHQDYAQGDMRLEMLELATAGHAQFKVSDMEVARGGVSYTVDTLEKIHQEQPGAELYLLIGADSLEELPQWRDPNRICQLACPVVVQRFGSSNTSFDRLANIASLDRLAEMKEHQVQMPRIEISSTALRRRIASGRGIRFQTTRAVEKYIQTHRLYRQADG